MTVGAPDCDAWMFDTRWLPEQSISVTDLEAWVTAGASGAWPAPLRCRYLARTLRDILSGDRAWCEQHRERWPEIGPNGSVVVRDGDLMEHIERETVCWVDLHMDVVDGRGVCRQAVIRPAAADGSLPRIPAVPLDHFVRRYVREGLHQVKVKVPTPRRSLGGVLPKVAAATMAHPEMPPPRAVMAVLGVDDREKAKRWVRLAKADGLLLA